MKIVDMAAPKDDPIFALCYGDSGTGKAQPLSAQVLTPEGYIRMGEVKIGTRVIDGNGYVTEVIGIYPQGVQDVYEVLFSDDSKTRCTLDHLWQVTRYAQGKAPVNQVVALKDIDLKKYKYRIPVPTVHFGRLSVQLPMDSYLLGCLIGDGYLSENTCVSFSNSEVDILEKVTLALQEFGDTLSGSPQHSWDYLIVKKYRDGEETTCKKILRDLGLLGCKSADKFIPKEYLMSSTVERQKLLWGLIDTDGYIDSNGSLAYTTVSDNLKDDMLWLVRSLGGTARAVKRAAHCNGKRCKDAYHIHIKFNNDFVFCSSKKQLSKVRERQFGAYRRIKSIRKIGQEICQCIMVDSSEHTYITDDFIVTHNTHLAGTLGEVGDVLIVEVDKGQKTLQIAPDLAKARERITICSFDAFKDLDTAYKYLSDNKPEKWNALFKQEVCTKPFDWFVWDTWSELQWHLLQELRSKEPEMKGAGLNFRKNIGIQHWGMMTDLNKLAIESLRECRINQLFLMQQTMNKDEISGQIYGGPAIHGKLVQEIPAYFDVVIRTYANMGGKFCATTKPIGKWTAKTRMGVGQEYIDPTAKQIFGL